MGFQRELKPQARRKKVRGVGVSAAQRSSDPCVSCTTFNILAPIYKRLDKEDQSRRESQYPRHWSTRNQKIINRLLEDLSSIICLQEVWLGNEELVSMYEKQLGDAGYTTLKLARTNDRGDGLLTAVRREDFMVLNYRELLFNDSGDRVAQLLHIESVAPLSLGRSAGCSSRQQILLVNTHLLFPHDISLCIVRLKQVYKILQLIESFRLEHDLNAIPVILCGDWNGSKRGHVYKFLRSQGFVSSYDTAHHYADSDTHKWVSHRNHRGNICGVDFIWLRNPNKHSQPLASSWRDAVFGMMKCLLPAVSLSGSGDDTFSFLRANGPSGCITLASFRRAICELGLCSHPDGITSDDIDSLWTQVDVDGKNTISKEEFKIIWNAKLPVTQPRSVRPETQSSERDTAGLEEATFGFRVEQAVLFPPEVEKGLWPEYYSLSDHAPLTVTFAPVSMRCCPPV